MKKMLVVFLIVFSILMIAVLSYFLRSKESPIISLQQSDLATPFPKASNDPINPTVSLVFVGDIMLDRNIRLKAQQNGYHSLIGPHLSTLLTSADYGIANLEGPVTANPSVSVGSEVGSTRNFIFTFAPESLDVLKKNNLTLVNLGNNHILNFGEEGLTETYTHLDQAGLMYFGYTSQTQPANSSLFILETPQGTLGFTNYNQFVSGGEEQAFADIESVRGQVDYLVMYTHWGNEYVSENQVLIDLAHRFIDAGVDLVIGSHPHVITGHEVYNNKHIYYSLGNFIFDQYFDEEVKKGLVVQATINPKTKDTTVSEHLVSISDLGQTELVP